MKNKFVRIIIFIISVLLLISSIYSLYEDVDYFLTKKETEGEILSVTNHYYDHKPLKITVQYKNDFINKIQTTSLDLESSYFNQLNKLDLKHIKLIYAKNNPNTIYLVGFNTPKIGIIFFDLSLIFLMSVGIYSALKP